MTQPDLFLQLCGPPYSRAELIAVIAVFALVVLMFEAMKARG